MKLLLLIGLSRPRFEFVKRNSGKLGALLLVLLMSFPGLCQVSVTVKTDRVSVEINGQPFTSLYKGADAHKPFLHPLLTASGKAVTRAFPMEHVEGEPVDHPHQRGLWMGFEHLSGMNFWELDPADPHPRMGTIAFRDVLESHSGKQTGGFTTTADWITPEGKSVIEQTLTLTFYAEPRDVRSFDVDLRLKAKATVTFEDTRDGIVGIRLAPLFDEANGGKVRNAEGVTGAAHIESTHSPWVDWQTDLQGETVGVAILDHPQNRRAPTTWILRPNCLVFANPFAQRYYSRALPDGSMTMQPGDELRLRYRVIIHPAGFDIGQAFREFSTQ